MAKIKASVLTTVALLLLIPGLLLDLITIKVAAKVAVKGMAPLEVSLLESTRSILGTVQDLWKNEQFFVSFLILFFSAIVPLIKLVLAYGAIWVQDQLKQQKLLRFLNLIGKWSMADVFVVAILIVFMAMQYVRQQTFPISVFGFNMRVELESTAVTFLHAGFYWFTGYCLFSILKNQILLRTVFSPATTKSSSAAASEGGSSGASD